MTGRDFLGNFFTLDPRQVDWQRTAYLAFVIVLLALVAKAYLMPEIREVQTTTFKRVREIQKVKDVQKVYVPCPEKGIVTYDKSAVAEKLHMPWLAAAPAAPPQAEEVSAPPEGRTASSNTSDLSDLSDGSDSLQVTATAELSESDRGSDVIAVFNSTTGQTDLVAKERPAPWVQFRNDYVLGLRYGMNQDLGQTATAYGSWTFLRFKSLYMSGYTELATDPRRPGEHLGWKGQLDLQYRH